MNIQQTSWKKVGTILFAVLWYMTVPAFAYDAQVSNGNGVRVVVKPIVLSPGQAAQFEVRLNTHSVELGQDLLKVAELRDDGGRSYRPDQWNGDPPGGHHRKGTLVFPAISSPVTSVTLMIREVANVPERAFTWKLEP